MRTRGSLVNAARTGAVLSGVGLLVASLRTEDLQRSGLLVFLGFTVLAAAAMPRPRAVAAAGFAIVFAVYGGISAIGAANDMGESESLYRRTVAPFVELGLSGSPVASEHVLRVNAFHDALELTVAGGLTAVITAALMVALLRRRPRPSRRWKVDPRDALGLGHLLVAVGFLGVLLALLRVGLRLGETPLFEAIKSFWDGGSYLLLVAHFALPGFALWFGALAVQRAARAAYRAPGLLLALFLVALIPTGQRTFIVESAAVALLLAALHRPPPLRTLIAGAAIAVVLLGVTQAARNQAREENRVSPAGVMSRLKPSSLPRLYASQFASFRWTVETERYKQQLDIDRPLFALLVKPVPQQLYAGKPAGFGEAFTRRLYPDATDADVQFATPLTAEAGYAFGWPGVIAAHGMLAAFVTGLLALAQLRAPPVLWPLGVMAASWTGFVFLRGDAGNAAFVAAGWIVPAAGCTWLLRRRRPRRIRRVVFDALQVPRELSGVAAQLLRMGEDLPRLPDGIEIVLRCPADVADRLAPAFPGAVVHTPLGRSRPRWRRLAYQQLVAPLRDGSSVLLVCPGDQAPLWGRAAILLIAHDIRRLTHPETATRSERFVFRAIQPGSLRRATCILTVSGHSRREILRVVRPSAPILVIADPLVRPKDVPYASGSDHVLVVGALRSYKGIETAIAAMAETGAHVPPLVLAGSDEGRREELEKAVADAGVVGRVEMPGWLPEAELETAYRRALVVVCPSQHEGYGLGVAASIARGLPTIASDIPPHVEIAGTAAVLVPPGDPGALARALDALCADEKARAHLRRAGLARAAELRDRRPSWGDGLLAALALAERSPMDAEVAAHVAGSAVAVT